MLKRYNDFIFESLITESVVVYSDTFRKLLKNIDSPVARGLEKIETQDLNITNNYIDIDRQDKEKITFVPDRRAQQMMGEKEKFAYITGGGFLTHSGGNQKMFDALGYVPTGDRMYHPQGNEKGEVVKKHVSETSGNTYVLLRFPGGESVINQENIRYDQPDPFAQGRQNIRIGRGIRGILSSGKMQFTDSEIEQFVNKYKSEIEKMNDVFRNFEVVNGDKISYWYDYSNYLHGRDRGPLSNSCMSAVSTRYFDIYTKNPEVCSLLILKDDEGTKIKGRALVWKLSTPDITFMDRIYCHADSDMELFRQYSKNQGWYYKSYNGSSHDDLDLIGPDGNETNMGDLTVSVKKGGYNSYPYLDTLQYLDRDNGILSTEEDRSSIYLIDTGGGYEGSYCDYCSGDGTVECGNCDGSGREDCDECGGDGDSECSDCDGDGEVECGSCDGTGEVDGEKCVDCDGDGKIECSKCDGDGKIDCDECDGRGTVSCSDCSGDGTRDCPECN